MDWYFPSWKSFFFEVYGTQVHDLLGWSVGPLCPFGLTWKILPKQQYYKIP